MSGRPKPYRRLCRGYDVLARCSLWLGKDHLLSVSNYGYSEVYKRFYFSDIQAIAVCKTARAAVITALCVAATLVVFALNVGFLGRDGLLPGVILSAPSLLALAINLALGPSCAAQIHTAAHWERLPAMRRLRRARNCLGRIRPLIEEAQGPLSEQMLESARELYAGLAAGAPLAQAAAGRYAGAVQVTGAAASAASGYTGAFHAWGFSLLLGHAAVTLLNVLMPFVLLMVTGLTLAMGAVGCLIGGAARQHRSGIGPALRNMTWVCLGYGGLLLVAGWIYSTLYALSDPLLALNQWEAWRRMANPRAWGLTGLMVMDYIKLIGSAALGGAGWAILLAERRRARYIPPRIQEVEQAPAGSSSG
jgi:hypothetical protein